MNHGMNKFFKISTLRHLNFRIGLLIWQFIRKVKEKKKETEEDSWTKKKKQKMMIIDIYKFISNLY